MRTHGKPWQDKLGGFAMKYLEAHRQTRDILQVPTGSIEELMLWAKDRQQQFSEALDKFPKPPTDGLRTRTIHLTKGFVRLVQRTEFFKGADLRAGSNELPLYQADILDLAQKIAGLLEKPKNRATGYIALSFGYTLFLRPLVEEMRNRQFGPEPLNPQKMATLASMCLDVLSNLLRGRLAVPKGRINQEGIRLIRMIQQHQTEPLTGRDLYCALKYAGLSMPMEERAWTVWLNRARKRSLIPRQTAQEATKKPS